MAKIVCKNCGQKNPSYAAACSNCGNFLVDEPTGGSSTPAREIHEENAPESIEQTVATQTTDEEEEEPEQETTTYTGRAETISVTSGNSRQYLSMIVGFAIFGAFIVLYYIVKNIPDYSLFIFMVLIFVVPTYIRRGASGVKFSAGGFSFPKTDNEEMFAYTDIENVKVGKYDKYDQSLTLFFKENHAPVKVNFRSFMAFRSLIVALNRRRVPITAPKQAASSR